MNIAPSYAVTPPVATPPVPTTRPVFTGQVIGTVPNADPDQAYPEVDLQPSRRVYGKKEGYALFEDALTAAMKLSAGDRNPAAAILKAKDRFWLTGVDRLETTVDFPGQDKVTLTKLRFENDPQSVATVEPNGPVVALVDGLASLVFGNPTTP